jgi:hypothetical protein
MKNTLKPLPSFLSETPRTDEVQHNVAELAMHSRKLERENAELIKDKPEDDIAWLQRQLEGEDDALTRAYRLGYQDGKRAFRKDKERLDWLIDNNCEIYEPDTALLYCDCDRESIDEMMAQATR